MKWLLIILITGFSFSACKTSRNSSAESLKPGALISDSLLAGIERGSCFGACPQYKAMIYKSGLVVYNGEKNVQKKGSFQAHLNTEQLLNLFDAIRQSSIESMDTVFVNKHLADFPGFSLWICDQKPARHIWVMHEAPPVAVTAIATKIDQLLNSELLDWQPSLAK